MKTFKIDLERTAGETVPFDSLIEAPDVAAALRKFKGQALGYSDEETARIDDRTLNYMWEKESTSLGLSGNIIIEAVPPPAAVQPGDFERLRCGPVQAPALPGDFERTRCGQNPERSLGIW
jgi:hypothetical protein